MGGVSSSSLNSQLSEPMVHQTSHIMSGSVQPVFLWDKTHEGGKSFVREDSDLYNKIVDKMTNLAKHLELSDDFLAKALQKEVIDDKTSETLKKDPTKEIRNVTLIRHILCGHMYQLHGFVWALTNTKQYGLVEDMGFKILDYIDWKLFMENSQFLCPSCNGYFLDKAYVLTSCGHYVCKTCMKGAKYHTKSSMVEVACPKCGQTNEVIPNEEEEEGISHEYDIGFKEMSVLTQKIVMEDHDKCTLCSLVLSTSPVKHYCRDCKSTLCNVCYQKHQEEKDTKSHGSDHQHAKGVCCLHGKETESHCSVCNIYFCQQCRDFCDHAHSVGEGNDGQMLDLKAALNKCLEEKRETEKNCIDNLDLFSVHEAGVKKHVEYERDRIVNWAMDRASKQLNKLQRIKQEATTKSTQVVKWQGALKDLSMLLDAQPWLFEGHIQEFIDVLSKSPEGLTEETRQFIRSLDSSPFLPDFLLCPSYCSIPPTEAKFIAEWKPEGGNVFDLEWTRDGDLVVAQHDQKLVSRLKVDPTNKEITSEKLEDEYQPTDVTCRSDGTIFISNKEGEVLVYEDGKEPVQWKPENVEKPWCVASNDKYIFVNEAESGSVFIYDGSERKFICNQYLCDAPGIYRLYATEKKLVATSTENVLFIAEIHVGEAVVDNSSANSSANILRVELGMSQKDMKRGDHPRGLCTFMNRYILVCDQKEEKISVYSLDGAFIHIITFEDGVPNALSVAVFHRIGQPALLALGSHQTLKVYTLQ